MDKDRRRRDVIRMKAGKVRKKVLALLLAGNGYIGIDRRGNNAGGAAGRKMPMWIQAVMNSFISFMKTISN